MEFTLADGTRIERKLSECRLSLMERSRRAPVVLGERGDEALLGAVTLEEFGLMLNPLNRTLAPMRMLPKIDVTGRSKSRTTRARARSNWTTFPGALGLGRPRTLGTNRTD